MLRCRKHMGFLVMCSYWRHVKLMEEWEGMLLAVRISDVERSRLRDERGLTDSAIDRRLVELVTSRVRHRELSRRRVSNMRARLLGKEEPYGVFSGVMPWEDSEFVSWWCSRPRRD
jgi:hypothetical protein